MVMCCAYLVWFRYDLRLDDQPALAAALSSGIPFWPSLSWTRKLTDGL